MQKREDIKKLFERYRQGRCTPEEQKRLHAWFNQYTKDDASGMDRLQAAFEAEHTARHQRGFRWLPYAAAIAIITLIGVWYINNDPMPNRKSENANLTSTDIAPGGNRATLTLADGRKIDLSETHSGIAIKDERITYQDEVTPVVRLGEVGASPTPEMLILTTPKGGTYQIMLSDGTQVWLNATSTLTYPSRFADNERIVEIDGEGYFLVAKDKSKPFRVISRGQEIEVLGTEFNISAYSDEAEVKTTLVEGSVRLQIGPIGERISLVPGEQVLLSNGKISKEIVDVTSYTAWKDGNFHFDNTALSDMMRQMSRWYDVEVVYESDVPKELFSGAMSRNVTLQTVLELLRISEINYRIQGNKLIIE